MKIENLVLLAIAGFGMWYLLRQNAQAQPTAMQRLVSADQIQSDFDAVRTARENLPPLRTVRTGSF